MIRRVGERELSEGGGRTHEKTIYSGDKTEKLWSQTYIQENTHTHYLSLYCTVTMPSKD